MGRGFVQAIRRKPLSHHTDAMQPRCRGDIVKAPIYGPHVHVCVDSAGDAVESRRRCNIEEEDGLIVHFDDVGNDELGVNRKLIDSMGKEVIRMDGKGIIEEAHFSENIVELPVVVVVVERVVRDASESVKYTLRQHVGRRF